MARVIAYVIADPHNPREVPRRERAANLDAAVIAAMRNGWTCRIEATGQHPDERSRSVVVEAGEVTTSVADEDMEWWARCARADLPKGAPPGTEPEQGEPVNGIEALS